MQYVQLYLSKVMVSPHWANLLPHTRVYIQGMHWDKIQPYPRIIGSNTYVQVPLEILLDPKDLPLADMHWLFYIGMPVLTNGASAICLDPNMFLWKQIQKILWCLSVTIIHRL
jgi:hypothetical protein